MCDPITYIKIEKTYVTFGSSNLYRKCMICYANY